MRRPVFGLALAFVAGFNPLCNGQPDQQAVQAWFDQAWVEAQHFPDLQGFSFSWSVEQYSTLSPEEVARLRHEVEGHPEHPHKSTLEAIDRARGRATANQHFTLWADKTGRWRYNSSCDEAPGVYFDKSLNGNRGWMLTPGVLNIVDMRRKPPEGKDVKAEQGMFLPQVGLLLNGGLTGAWLAGLSPGSVTLNARGWTVEASVRDGVRGDVLLSIEYSGRWSDENDRGFVERTRITRSAAEGGAGETQVVRDWHLEPTLGRWVAHRADVYTPEGALDRSILFASASSVSDREFAGLLNTPSNGTIDAARGEIHLTRINDWAMGTFTDIRPEGSTTTPVDGGSSANVRDRWQLVGWIMGASLVAGLVGMALRKRYATA